MQIFKTPKLIQNLLVLTAVVGIALSGWLAGHILRHTLPGLEHPPIERIDPHIENGFRIEFEDERFAITPQASPWVQVYLGGSQIDSMGLCLATTYYTSLPAKCHTPDGELAIVGGVQRQVILIPSDESK
jgi:hypothetical protein